MQHPNGLYVIPKHIAANSLKGCDVARRGYRDFGEAVQKIGQNVNASLRLTRLPSTHRGCLHWRALFSYVINIQALEAGMCSHCRYRLIRMCKPTKCYGTAGLNFVPRTEAALE